MLQCIVGFNKDLKNFQSNLIHSVHIWQPTSQPSCSSISATPGGGGAASQPPSCSWGQLGKDSCSVEAGHSAGLSLTPALIPSGSIISFIWKRRLKLHRPSAEDVWLLNSLTTRVPLF
ncbi:hypothetical protein PGIGA_G00169020 [Pangasianodon gigas]|uniref:Uncharacterized protein n=1 Tax=Pangasianodon gigas TaxID=30993 RepID=A0ACC5XUP2_PANGG|nr:hypothetical protein [Pangasianodon gigas]